MLNPVLYLWIYQLCVISHNQTIFLFRGNAMYVQVTIKNINVFKCVTLLRALSTFALSAGGGKLHVQPWQLAHTD